MRQTNRKLVLARDTLRTLSGGELGRAGGGELVPAGPTQPRCGININSVVLGGNPTLCGIIGTFDDPNHPAGGNLIKL